MEIDIKSWMLVAAIITALSPYLILWISYLQKRNEKRENKQDTVDEELKEHIENMSSSMVEMKSMLSRQETTCALTRNNISDNINRMEKDIRENRDSIAASNISIKALEEKVKTSLILKGKKK